MERLTICWIDSYGNEIMTNISGPSDEPDLIFCVAAISGISNAAETNYTLGNITFPGSGAPTPEPYASVGETLAVIHNDVLVTQFQTFYPAPMKTLFDAGWNATDILNATFDAFSVQCFDTLMVPQSGYPVQTTPAGWLMRQAAGVRESYIVNPSITVGKPNRRRMVVWADTFGERVLYAYPMMDVSDNWLTAAAALSNAAVVQTWEGLVAYTPIPAPFALPYAGVKDFARLTFADAKGNRANVHVPAPKLSIFQADGKTVNPAAMGVPSVLANVEGYAVAPQSGLPLTTYIGGVLVRNKSRGLQ